MNANAKMLERSLRAVWHPCTQMKHHETLPLVPVSRCMLMPPTSVRRVLRRRHSH